MKKFLLYAAVIGAVALIIAGASRSVSYASEALDMCFEMIIPTLFPFFICSGMLIYSGFCEVLAKAFRFCMMPLFRINPAGSSAFILGIVSGYPLGAVTAGELYTNNYLSKTEAERLLAFCNNSGPLFILGSVGAAVYSDMRFGVMLYISHILAALTVGIIFRFYKTSQYVAPPTVMGTPKRPIGEIFNIALQNAVSSILTVCGAVLFFSVISRLFLDLLPLSAGLGAVASGICEFVTGTLKISALDIPTASKLILTSAVVGFAGLSVHVQVMAVVSKYGLSLKPYIIGKIFHGIIAAVYTFICLRLRPIAEFTFAPSAGRAFAAVSVYEAIFTAITILACGACAVWLYLRSCRCEGTLKNKGH